MRAPALLVLPLLVACGNAPLTGEWDYTDEDVIENTCSDAIDYDGTSGAFTIDNQGDGTFIVDPLDGTEPFACTVDKKDYTCPERVSEVLDLGGGAEAELTVSVSGEFLKKDEAIGTQTATLTCLDAGCEAAAALVGIPSPCTIVVDFEAEWTGEL